MYLKIPHDPQIDVVLLRNDTGEFGLETSAFVVFFLGLFTTTQTVGSSLGDLVSGGMPGAGQGYKKTTCWGRRSGTKNAERRGKEEKEEKEEEDEKGC